MTPKTRPLFSPCNVVISRAVILKLGHALDSSRNFQKLMLGRNLVGFTRMCGVETQTPARLEASLYFQQWASHTENVWFSALSLSY